ncbi:MAG: Nramp family divalent metal transporter, partial [Acidobacteriota bacterium]
MMAQVGPGFVYILTVLGAGDLVSNSAAGAGYGYALIWTVAVGMILRFVWVNVSAKYVLVTGETLIQGYARVGQWVVWLILISMIILVHFYNMYMILMSGNAIHVLFPLPTEWSSSIWSLFFALVAFVMAYWGGYQAIEFFCKILVGMMGGALILVAFLSHPDPAQIARGLFIPTIPGSQGLYEARFMLMALIGTMTGSIINLTYAYFIYEKGWRDISYLKTQRFDLIFGVSCMFVMGVLLQIAAAATVHPLGLELKDASDMVRIFSEVQGVIGMIVFSLGLWGAAFSTLIGTTVGCS